MYISYNIKELCSIASLGLDIIEPFKKYDSPESLAKLPRQDFDVVKGHSKIPELIRALTRRGYKDADIEGILSKNFMRVYKEVWK